MEDKQIGDDKIMGKIYLYTGDGAGKTTNALGLALRAIGHGKKVFMLQLMKWNTNTGEYQAQFMEKIKEYLTVKQYGRKGWHGLNSLNRRDKEKALEALIETWRYITDNKTDLLILDEINLAVYCKLLTVDEVKQFLNNIPQDMNIVMTGRHATEELMELADFVNEIVTIKAPDEDVCDEGVQY
jgi:cob(I)alamin adenosyltransferase